MSVQIQVGPRAFSFASFQQWVDRAQSWFGQLPPSARGRYLCIDAVGRVCLIGRDFMRARDEGTFPVVVFLIDSDGTASQTSPGIPASSALDSGASGEIAHPGVSTSSVPTAVHRAEGGENAPRDGGSAK